MNSKDIKFISESYFQISEANRGEQYRGLTPKERKDERNKNVPFRGDYSKEDSATHERRFRHTQLRDISPRKRRADIERQYVYSKNEWEKNNPGKSYDDRYNYDDDDYEYDHSHESDPYYNTPRMPGNKPGRRKPLGTNNIRRVQPYLNFSRSRTRRREELSQERKKENQKQREIYRQNNDNNWKKFMAMQDMQDRINGPRNKIVKFQREEIELILNYLLDEGYANSFNSAELIFENMSDKWIHQIFIVSGYIPYNR